MVISCEIYETSLLSFISSFTDVYRQCGEVFQSSTGSVTAPDFDGDGLYDTNVDCLWTVQAPENYVIRYEIQFYEIEETSLHCVSDALMVIVFRYIQFSIKHSGSVPVGDGNLFNRKRYYISHGFKLS